MGGGGTPESGTLKIKKKKKLPKSFNLLNLLRMRIRVRQVRNVENGRHIPLMEKTCMVIDGTFPLLHSRRPSHSLMQV